MTSLAMLLALVLLVNLLRQVHHAQPWVYYIVIHWTAAYTPTKNTAVETAQEEIAFDAGRREHHCAYYQLTDQQKHPTTLRYTPMNIQTVTSQFHQV